MLTLSARISSWRLRSVHTSAPYAHAQHVLKGTFQIWNLEMDEYRVRIEKDDLYPPQESLFKDFTHFWDNLGDDY